MEQEEDYWNYSEKDLIELMGQTGAGDNFVIYQTFSNTKFQKKLRLIPRGLFGPLGGWLS